MRRVVPLLIVLCLGFAPAPVYREKPDARTDLEKIQGAWCRMSLTIGGEAHPQATTAATIVITGTHLQFPSRADAWAVTLDATKDPKRIDYREAWRETISFRGIYRLEGDTLTVCFDQGGRGENGRPAKFESPAGSSVWLQVFKRKKP